MELATVEENQQIDSVENEQNAIKSNSLHITAAEPNEVVLEAQPVLQENLEPKKTALELPRTPALLNIPDSNSLSRQGSPSSNAPESNNRSLASPYILHSPSSTPSSFIKIKPNGTMVLPLNDTPEAISPREKISLESSVDGSSPSKNYNPSYSKNTPAYEEFPLSTTSSLPQSISMNRSENSTAKRRQRSEREVLIGTPVKEGHVNYMLMYDMLTGIRISVSRCYAKPHREVTEEDFTAAHKLAFDV